MQFGPPICKSVSPAVLVLFMYNPTSLAEPAPPSGAIKTVPRNSQSPSVSKLPEVSTANLLELILIPPPVIVKLVAFAAPALSTLNAPLAPRCIPSLPKYIPASLSANEVLFAVCKAVVPIVNPAAVITPFVSIPK